MSRISQCPRCGGNVVEPAYPGDGAYPVPPMCSCGDDKRCLVCNQRSGKDICRGCERDMTEQARSLRA